jgi:hypothetical protein
MKVFLSWSKEKGKLTAEAFSRWLPKVIQAIDPWISSSDIDKGRRWSAEISKILEETQIGIICLNQENLNEPWILFEAGALAKTNDAYVCTFLLDIAPTDVQQPLGQFQHTKYEKEDVRKLVKTINASLKKCEEKELKEEALDDIFEKFWPDFDSDLKKVNEKKPSSTVTKRSDRELLEEILEILRNQDPHFVDFNSSSGMLTPSLFANQAITSPFYSSTASGTTPVTFQALHYPKRPNRQACVKCKKIYLSSSLDENGLCTKCRS